MKSLAATLLIFGAFLVMPEVTLDTPAPAALDTAGSVDPAVVPAKPMTPDAPTQLRMELVVADAPAPDAPEVAWLDNTSMPVPSMDTNAARPAAYGGVMRMATPDTLWVDAMDVLPGVDATVYLLSAQATSIASVREPALTGDAAEPATEVQMADAPQPASAANEDTVAEAPQAALDTIERRAVLARVLNMRSGPSSRTRVVGAMANGEEALLLGETKGGWVKVRAGSDGTEGWVFAKYLGEAGA
ncbi:MAG: SH3 domain-containing protein [Rhodobacter sp.]|nr:SH3 domain-containing protein [Rhodobacter sp.]